MSQCSIRGGKDNSGLVERDNLLIAVDIAPGGSLKVKIGS
jgi:hypothetical protein